MILVPEKLSLHYVITVFEGCLKVVFSLIKCTKEWFCTKVSDINSNTL
jgi:hypothetical protein